MMEIFKENMGRFFRKFFWRFLSRLLEIALLGSIGYGLGFKLVRY